MGFSLFRRGPSFIDVEFRDLSLMLTQDDDNPTHRRELLDPAKLDFSFDSLRHLDEYLEALHRDPPQGADLMRVALRCGAYVGEVMRRQLPGTYHWVSHDEAAKHSKLVAGFERSVATAAVLWKNAGSMCFPLGKVCKYIENGNEDSVHFFATAIVESERKGES